MRLEWIWVTLSCIALLKVHCVAGKVNIVIIFCIIAGGGYLDLITIFDISPTCFSPTCYLLMMYEVLHYWIVDIDIGDTCIDSYLDDKEAVVKASAGFS